MNSKEIFKLAVRLLGLVFLYRGLSDFPGIITACMSLSILGILITIWPLVVAFGLLRGTEWLVNLTYTDAED
jgi:hypothetical protein